QTCNSKLAGGSTSRPCRQHVQHVGHLAGYEAIAAVAAAIQESRDRFGGGRYPNEIVSRFFDRQCDVRIFVDVVVVDEVQLCAALVQNGERAVKAGAGTGRHDIENQRLPRLGVKAEHIVIVRLDHTVDHRRQPNRLCMLEVIVRLHLALARERPYVKHAHVRAARSAQAVSWRPTGAFGPTEMRALAEKKSEESTSAWMSGRAKL